MIAKQASARHFWIFLSTNFLFRRLAKEGRKIGELERKMLETRRSRASVSKVISQQRSLGGLRPVDRAAGAALRSIDLTHVRVYSRAIHNDFFSAFFDPTKGRRLAFACFPFFFDHFDWQKLFSNHKKCHASALPAPVEGSSYLSSSKVKNKDRWTTNGIDRTVSVEQTEEHSHAKLELKERAIFPLPLIVQDFDRRSNPNFPFNDAQANLTTDERHRRLYEKFFAPGVNNRRFPSPKTKPCKKLKKPFLFAFGHSHSFPSFFLFFVTFHRRTVELKTYLATRQKKWKISRCTETCIGPTVGAVGPTVGAGWLHWSSSFRNFANFLPRTKLFAPKQRLKTWLFKTPAKTEVLPAETICRILWSTRSQALR